MIEKHHSRLSVRKQCELLAVNRNRLSPRQPKRVDGDEAIMKEIDRIYTEFPFYGARKIMLELHEVGIRIGRKRCRRLMRAMGIEALVPKPSTSVPDKQHKKYPYLLRESAVSAPDEVWAADITYVPMYEGHVYLVAIMDWHTRAVLSWRVSTTMDAGFCVEAYREALRVAGRAPAIMNTDQGSQFTCGEWIEVVEASGARVSMDGKGRWMDNVFIERLWRSLKYEQLRLWSYGTVAEVTHQIGKWMDFYNHRRKHQALDYEVPWPLYRPDGDRIEDKTLTKHKFPPRGTEARAA
jgi:putative transposase